MILKCDRRVVLENGLNQTRPNMRERTRDLHTCALVALFEPGDIQYMRGYMLAQHNSTEVTTSTGSFIVRPYIV